MEKEYVTARLFKHRRAADGMNTRVSIMLTNRLNI